MRKIRRVRVVGALGIVVVGAAAAGVGVLRATSREAPPPARVTGGARACATGAVLDLAVEVHQRGGDEAAVVALVRQASSCATVTRTSWPEMQVYTVLRQVADAASRAEAVGRHDEALALAVDVWTIGVEQGRAESFVGAMTGVASAMLARETVADALPSASPRAADAARARLTGLAAVDLPVADVLGRSERYAWTAAGLDPRWVWATVRLAARYRRAASALDGLEDRGALDGLAHGGDPVTRMIAAGVLDALALRADARALASRRPPG